MNGISSVGKNTVMLWALILMLLLPSVTGYVFTMALLAPFTGSRRMSEIEVKAAVNVTLEKFLKNETLGGLVEGNHTVNFLINDTECDRGAGVYKFVEMVTHKLQTTSQRIHAVIVHGKKMPWIMEQLRGNLHGNLHGMTNSRGQFHVMPYGLKYEQAVCVGPSCDNVCESVGLLAGRWEMPVISFGCFSDDLSNRRDYPTLLRMTGSFKEVGIFLRSIMTYFEWKRITLVVGGESAWLRAAEDILMDFRDVGIDPRRLQMKDMDNLTLALAEEAQMTRVFVICAYGQDIHRFMLEAHKAGLINGKFVFLTIDYANMANRIKNSYTSSVPYADVFRGILDVTVDVHPEKPEFQDFVKRVEAFKGTPTNSPNYENGIQVALVADAVYLYLLALNNCIEAGGLCPKGSDITDFLYGIEKEGVAGNLVVNTDGSRHIAYMLHNIRGDKYTPIARSDAGGVGFTILGNVDDIVWPGGGNVIPKAAPPCGWNNELCNTDNTPVIIGSVLGTLVAAGILGAAFYILWKYVCFCTPDWDFVLCRGKLARVRLERDDWRVNKDYITPIVMQKSMYSIKTISSYSKSESSSNACSSNEQSGGSLHSDNKNMTSVINDQTTLAMYDNQKVVLKNVARYDIPVTKDIIIEINAIRLLSHPNINTLIGAFTEPGSNGLVWHYCSRGSLHDVLLAEEIKLDWLFNISFASDIARAMIYIHSSIVETHGALKSTNILIDSHWVCKLGDMAMPYFRQGEQEPGENHSKYFRYLWTAPEVLRNQTEYRKGTQKGDIFSYSIIIQEILTRSFPYGNVLSERADDKKMEQILNKVKNVEIPPYRPHVPQTSKEEGLLADVMRLCWDEVPASRPSFENVLHLLTKLNKGRKTNILDQMIHRMTKYSEHLENMIQERTLMLNEEKKKTDQILSKMLPRAVIEDLKVGKSIEPESFPSVTVFFADVVGFTKLAAESTPYQVVNFLNSLYTMFDYVIDHFDVYKVETIGDAYMVVSGLPIKNGIEHAGQICSMSLQLLSSVDKFKIAHRPSLKLKLRIGVHSGSVVAGVVGQTMPRYCLFGDTVNYASRMESTGEALQIHVSPECKMLLDELGGYHLRERGEITMKGKGTIVTFFLMSKDGFVDKISANEINTSIHDHRFN